MLQINLNAGDGLSERLVSEDKFASQSALVGPSAARPAGNRKPAGSSISASVAAGAIGTQVFSTFGSTTEADESNHAGVVGGASRCFSFRPESDGLLSIDTEGSDFDTVLAI